MFQGSVEQKIGGKSRSGCRSVQTVNATATTPRRDIMIFHSPYPDVVISELALTPFVLQHAEKLAAKPALINAASDRVLTYGELAEEVQYVASGLLRRGMRKGDVFGIYAPN